MTKLEMIYLMNVALHLTTIQDIQTFEQINKKASTVLHSLKINPWLIDNEDITKFCEIFCPSTCNCNSMFIPFDILDQSLKIRNLNLFLRNDGIIQFEYQNEYKKENKSEKYQHEKMMEIVRKCESMHLTIENEMYTNETTLLLEENKKRKMEFFLSITKDMKIEFKDMYSFQLFERYMTQQPNYIYFYPKQIELVFNEPPFYNDNVELNINIIDAKRKNIICLIHGYHELTYDEVMSLKQNNINCYMNCSNGEYYDQEFISYFFSSHQHKLYHQYIIDTNQFEDQIEFSNYFNVPKNVLFDEQKRKRIWKILERMYCQGIYILSENGQLFDEIIQQEDVSQYRMATIQPIENEINILNENEMKITFPSFIKCLLFNQSSQSDTFPFDLNGIEELSINNNSAFICSCDQYKNEYSFPIKIPINNSLKKVSFQRVTIIPIDTSSDNQENCKINDLIEQNLFINVRELRLKQVRQLCLSSNMSFLQKLILKDCQFIDSSSQTIEMNNDQTNIPIIPYHRSIITNSISLNNIFIQDCVSCKFQLHLTNNNPIYLCKVENCLFEITLEKNVFPSIYLTQCSNVHFISENHCFEKQLNALDMYGCKQIIFQSELQSLQRLFVGTTFDFKKQTSIKTEYCTVNANSLHLTNIKLNQCNHCNFVLMINSTQFNEIKDVYNSQITIHLNDSISKHSLQIKNCHSTTIHSDKDVTIIN